MSNISTVVIYLNHTPTIALFWVLHSSSIVSRVVQQLVIRQWLPYCTSSSPLFVQAFYTLTHNRILWLPVFLHFSTSSQKAIDTTNSNIVHNPLVESNADHLNAFETNLGLSVVHPNTSSNACTRRSRSAFSPEIVFLEYLSGFLSLTDADRSKLSTSKNLTRLEESSRYAKYTAK